MMNAVALHHIVCYIYIYIYSSNIWLNAFLLQIKTASLSFIYYTLYASCLYNHIIKDYYYYYITQLPNMSRVLVYV